MSCFHRRLLVVFCTLAVACVCAPATYGMFLDDFEDGDATDGSPVLWNVGFSGGTRDVVDGSYLLDPGRVSPISSFVEVEHADISIRAQARFLEDGDPADTIAIWGRDRHGVDAGYWGGIRIDGQLVLGVGSITLARENSSLDPINSDVSLQLDLSGDKISLTAWSDGFARPALPQLSATDTTFPDGNLLGVVVFNLSNPSADHSPAAFRYVEVVAVPEPPGRAMLAMGALVGLWFVSVRRAQYGCRDVTSQRRRHRSADPAGGGW